MLKWILGCLLLCGMGTVQIASADQISGTLNLGATNWNAAGTLTTSGGSNGTWSLTFNFNNKTGNTVDVNSFGVQLFSAGPSESFTVTNATLNGGSLGAWEYFADDKLNNGNSSPTCSSNTIKGWLCADTGQPTVNPYSIGSGQSAMFVFSGTYANTGAINTLDLMASGCIVAGTCSLDGGTNNLNKWAVSLPMTTASPVPEPASLALLASGLLMIGMLLKRR